jgi:hypothetical protein
VPTLLLAQTHRDRFQRGWWRYHGGAATPITATVPAHSAWKPVHDGSAALPPGRERGQGDPPWGASELRIYWIESRWPGVVGPGTYDVPMQTDDNGTRPVLDGLDALFADLGEERSEPNLLLANSCCASKGETLSIQDLPVVGDGGLLACFQE